MRLIDADALTEELYDLKYTKECPSIILTPTGQEIYNSGVETATGTVLSAPIVDAVPVVRCRDCWKRGGYHCPMYHTETSLDDLDGFDDYNVDRTDGDGFCHRGERREQNDLRECEEMDFVSGNLTERTAYEGLAEECCELAQAALKAIRAADGENPTPVSLEEAKEKIREEAGDVMMYLELLGYIPRGTTKNNPKWKRWAKRIRERGKE